MPNAQATLQQVIEHRLAREAAILKALEGHAGRRIPDLVAELYGCVPKGMHGLAELSVYAHLIKLAAGGRVACFDRSGVWRRAA